MKVLLLLIMTLLAAPVYTYPNKRSSGFERLRDRIHRKRHRHHQKPMVVSEVDDLFEMSANLPPSPEDEVDETFRVRSGKSIPGPLTTPTTVTHKRHHHNHHKKNRREKNEELCQSQRKTVELNTQSHEFDPPFVVEVRCLNTPSSIGGSIFQQEQTCFKGMLRCVQQYADVHVTRRGVGSMHWHPYTIPDVPVSCQCMWPVDRYGHQEF